MATQFLSNDYLGPAYTLQPHPHSRTNGLHAAPSRYGGLIWAIVPSPEHAGKFNICTTHNGRPKCLDIYNDGSSDRTRVCLADPGHYSGQTWSLEPQGHGRCKLSNDWTGPGWYLDTYSDSHEAFVSRGDFSGQQWLISVPLLASGRHYPMRYVATDVLGPVYRDYSNSQGPHHHGSTAGKVAGGVGAAYPASRSGFKVRTARLATERPLRILNLDREPAHKLWNKLS